MVQAHHTHTQTGHATSRVHSLAHNQEILSKCLIRSETPGPVHLSMRAMQGPSQLCRQGILPWDRTGAIATGRLCPPSPQLVFRDAKASVSVQTLFRMKEQRKRKQSGSGRGNVRHTCACSSLQPAPAEQQCKWLTQPAAPHPEVIHSRTAPISWDIPLWSWDLQGTITLSGFSVPLQEGQRASWLGHLSPQNCFRPSVASPGPFWGLFSSLPEAQRWI